jgi:hypothetical protein
MQTIELPSPGTTQPTMFYYGVTMNNKAIKKFRKAGYRPVKQFKGFKWCRKLLLKLSLKD